LAGEEKKIGTIQTLNMQAEIKLFLLKIGKYNGDVTACNGRANVRGTFPDMLTVAQNNETADPGHAADFACMPSAR